MIAGWSEDWLLAQSRTRPSATAVVFEGRAESFSSLNDKVDEFVRELMDRGVVQGDRVVSKLDPSVRFCVAAAACFRIGAVFVPLSSGDRDEETTRKIAAVGARCLIDDMTLRALDGESHPAAKDLAAIVFTSGTDGHAKPVSLTLRNFYQSALATMDRLDLTPSDRWLATMPLHHVGGLSILTRSLISGFTVILEQGFDTDRGLETLTREKITVVSVVPTMLHRMVERLESDAAALPFGGTLRCMLVGGAALPCSCQDAVEVLQRAGIVEQELPRQCLKVDKVVRVGNADQWIEARPADRLILKYGMDYGRNAVIERRELEWVADVESFVTDIAPARTFILESTAKVLRSQGFGLRSSYSDLLVFGDDGPIDNELRFQDECVRHKILDLVGDLALAGCDIQGYILAHRSGHRLNAALVSALQASHALSFQQRDSA